MTIREYINSLCDDIRYEFVARDQNEPMTMAELGTIAIAFHDHAARHKQELLEQGKRDDK